MAPGRTEERGRGIMGDGDPHWLRGIRWIQVHTTLAAIVSGLLYFIPRWRSEMATAAHWLPGVLLATFVLSAGIIGLRIFHHFRQRILNGQELAARRVRLRNLNEQAKFRLCRCLSDRSRFIPYWGGVELADLVHYGIIENHPNDPTTAQVEMGYWEIIDSEPEIINLDKYMPDQFERIAKRKPRREPHQESSAAKP